MCLLLASRAHPDYELVLISNRDEFFGREAITTRWNDDDYVLCPCDVPLTLDSHRFGTWCGINKAGNVATILNLKLDNVYNRENLPHLTSRGKVPSAYLSDRKSPFEDWNTYGKFTDHYDGLNSTGDFNFFYGNCREANYRIIDSLTNTFTVLQDSDPTSDDSYVVVCNEPFHPRESHWKKVQLAKEHLRNLIQKNNQINQEAFIAECFNVASINPYKDHNDDTMMKSDRITREAIFVPPLKVVTKPSFGKTTQERFYGTRSQIVILVNKERTKITFVERVIHNSEDKIELRSPEKPAEQVKFVFDLIN
ncbi:related to Weak similarity to mouse T10 protein [Zygosaccharomyces bailii ISA1307]|nr:related to Weak similarity to mouse T10 protein [Zygosaccharomyces bailii ISA1307]